MKLKGLLILMTIVLVKVCFAQDVSFKTAIPDFKIIETNISDEHSVFYYPVLMKRYKDNDTTLNIEEYRYLYYGFPFQDGYSAYGSSKYNDELEKVFEKKDLTDADREKIIVLEKKVLIEFPFNLRNLNTLINVMEQQGDTVVAILQIKKLVGVANAIMSTGMENLKKRPCM